MRIDTRQIVQQVPGVKSKGLGGVHEASGPADSADFSARAADFQRVMDALKIAPEVREAQVDDLKQQVESGTFDASGSSIADKLLGA
jgi:flagellar biosynthesis anti-sigma factor FlgM